MNIIRSLRRYLALQDDVTLTLGHNHEWDTWIFQDRLYAMVEGTSQVAVVLSQRGAWTSPNSYNTLRTPRIAVEIYADPTRSGNRLEVRDAGDKAMAAFEAIDQHMHLVSGGTVMWDDLRIVGSTRLDEPEVFDVPDGDGMVRAQVFYGVGVG